MDDNNPRWYAIVLRRRGAARVLVTKLEKKGAEVVAVPGFRIQARDDDETRGALVGALSAPNVIFTSPNSVRAASRLLKLRKKPGQRLFAIGPSTAACLGRRGIRDVVEPGGRANSENLLEALFETGKPKSVGLITAPAGRGLIEAALKGREVPVHRANVYQRVLPKPRGEDLAALDLALPKSRARAHESRPVLVIVSSAAAWRGLRDSLPGAYAKRFMLVPVIASSGRIADALTRDGAVVAMVASGSDASSLAAKAAEAAAMVLD